jgi:hypothetical protein
LDFQPVNSTVSTPFLLSPKFFRFDWPAEFGYYLALPMSSREEELIARELLAKQELIDAYFKQKRWAELAALVRFARRDAPVRLAQTDPALYRQLREQITRFYLRGGDAFSLEKLEAMAAEAKDAGID